MRRTSAGSRAGSGLQQAQTAPCQLPEVTKRTLRKEPSRLLSKYRSHQVLYLKMQITEEMYTFAIYSATVPHTASRIVEGKCLQCKSTCHRVVRWD